MKYLPLREARPGDFLCHVRDKSEGCKPRPILTTNETYVTYLYYNTFKATLRFHKAIRQSVSECNVLRLEEGD